eukprot:340449-Rhodomonas_salina.1
MRRTLRIDFPLAPPSGLAFRPLKVGCKLSFASSKPEHFKYCSRPDLEPILEILDRIFRVIARPPPFVAMSFKLVLATLLCMAVAAHAFAPLSLGQCTIGVHRPGLRGHSVTMMAKKKSGGGAAAKVQVLLKANVEGVGKANEVITVNTGYFNNFLRPKALADLISDAEVEVKEAKEQEARDELKQEAVDQAAALKAMGSVVVKRKVGAGGKIFGSVTSKQLIDEIKTKTDGKSASILISWTPPLFCTDASACCQLRSAPSSSGMCRRCTGSGSSQPRSSCTRMSAGPSKSAWRKRSEGRVHALRASGARQACSFPFDEVSSRINAEMGRIRGPLASPLQAHQTPSMHTCCSAVCSSMPRATATIRQQTPPLSRTLVAAKPAWLQPQAVSVAYLFEPPLPRRTAAPQPLRLAASYVQAAPPRLPSRLRLALSSEHGAERRLALRGCSGRRLLGGGGAGHEGVEVARHQPH